MDAPVAAFVLAGRRYPEPGNAEATAASAGSGRSQRLPLGERRASLAGQQIKPNVPMCEDRTADRLGPGGEAEPASDAGAEHLFSGGHDERHTPGSRGLAGWLLPDDLTGVEIHSR